MKLKGLCPECRIYHINTPCPVPTPDGILESLRLSVENAIDKIKIPDTDHFTKAHVLKKGLKQILDEIGGIKSTFYDYDNNSQLTGPIGSVGTDTTRPFNI